MTIQEAIRSGKRFRRPGHPWYEIRFDAIKYCHSSNPESIGLDNILADDWEVEEEKIEITKSRLRAAFCNASFLVHHLNGHSEYVTRLSPLEKELGFKDNG